MSTGRARITKRRWYDLGGFANPKLFRNADARGYWRYYMLLD
jgi:hypothetical protein